MTSLRPLVCVIALTAALPAAMAQSDDTEAVTRGLAAELVKEGDARGAAIEYRRLALTANEPADRNSYRWLSSLYYLQERQPDVAMTLLDDLETPADDLTWKADLLRAEAAKVSGNTGEEIFYLQSVLADEGLDKESRDYVSRQLAAALVRDGQTNEARAVLAASPLPDAGALASMDEYMAGHDKSPAVGGWLGMIPGAGYMYAGEYANGFRSLILNSLFIFGMVASADDDEWGAFAVISFFEITWYTGSIYGGIDASHRYNRQRKQSLLDAISGGLIMEPDQGEIPAILLKYRF